MKILRFLHFGRWGTTFRIAFALAMWTATVMLGLRIVGLLDDGIVRELEARLDTCEAVAISCSQSIGEGNDQHVAVMLNELVRRNDEILSAACLFDGSTIAQTSSHDELWDRTEKSGIDRVSVPIMAQGDRGGTVNVAFRTPVAAGLIGFLQRRSIQVTFLAATLNLIGFCFITRRCFRDLDPSKVVPDRVRSALDTMAEMVLVLDEAYRIVLTNRSFTERFATDNESLQGRHSDSLPWLLPGDLSFSQLCTQRANGDMEAPMVQLRVGAHLIRTLKLNVSGIDDEAGVRRGYLVSLDDVTMLEEKQSALQKALEELKESQLEIEAQNEQLQYMATRDPMTDCLNRRAFFDKMDELWKSTKRYRHALSCLMVDVDHFKSINDNHGHAVGDEVLKAVAQALRETARETDYVCRYGGEEFCVILPHVDIDGAAQAGERFRTAIAGLAFDQLSVTASLGCSSVSLGPASVESLIDQADQALYVAKNHGRNRVVRFDQIAEIEFDSNGASAIAASK